MQIKVLCMPTVGNYHNIAVKLYSTCTWWVWHSGIERYICMYGKPKRNYFCGMEKCSRKRSITRLPPLSQAPGIGNWEIHQSEANPGSLILTRLRFTQSNALATR